MRSYQIEAARAMAKWSQEDLAEHAGSSLSTISQVETGGREPSAALERKIVEAFVKEGIFFTEYGVEKRNTSTYTIEGEGFWLRVLDDVYQSLMDVKSAELLLFCSDDRESPPEVNAMYRKIRNQGVKMRQLVREDNTYLLGGVEEYRWIPKEYFENYVTMVYGDKVCVCAEGNTKAMIFKDKQMAKTFRNLFNWNWENAEKPTETTAPKSERL